MLPPLHRWHKTSCSRLMYYSTTTSCADPLVGCSVFRSIKLTMDLGLATLLAQLFEWPEKQPNCCVSGLNLLQLQKKKKLSYALSHTLPLSLLLVCTHSNCVSSHLITLSSTLASLLVTHTHTHVHAHAHADSKEAYQPTAMLGIIWYKKETSCDLCTQLSHAPHVPQFYILCSLSLVCLSTLCTELPSPTVHYDLFKLRRRLCLYLRLLWMTECLFVSLIVRDGTTERENPNHSGISRAGHFYFLCLRSGYVYCKGPFIMYSAVLY